MYKKIYNWITNEKDTDLLKIPRDKEAQGILSLGDPGSGKSQTKHQFIYQARQRQEPGVCYDPAAEFVQTHYRERFDYILNPLDERFPNWQLSWEIQTVSDLDLVAESFFPTQHLSDEKAKFFNRAAQDVFRLILEKGWTNEKIVRVLSDVSELDKLVEGTEVAHKIDSAAGPQRAGVLAVLGDVAKALRYIPELSEEKKNFTLTSWTRAKRVSWLFLTTTSDTRDTLRPLQSAILNILMRRLMSIKQSERKNEAWWFIADELHSLNSLSALPEFVAECRKHGIRYVFGTQNKHQLLHRYGQEAKTILASPILKIFYRCNEPETARWISDLIGNQERIKPRTSASLALDDKGRKSINFSNETETRAVVSKEEIMHLSDLQGFWKYSDTVVPFELKYIKWKKLHPDFLPRRINMKESAAKPTSQPVSTKQPEDNFDKPKDQNTSADDRDAPDKNKVSVQKQEVTKRIIDEINLDF